MGKDGKSWENALQECRNFAVSWKSRPSGLHLQTPRGNTCRLPGPTRADSGGCKTGQELTHLSNN